MAPAIQKGERVWINKLAYLFGEPRQGELVAFHCDVYSEDGEGSTLVKRVAAVSYTHLTFTLRLPSAPEIPPSVMYSFPFRYTFPFFISISSPGKPTTRLIILSP